MGVWVVNKDIAIYCSGVIAIARFDSLEDTQASASRKACDWKSESEIEHSRPQRSRNISISAALFALDVFPITTLRQ